MLRKNCKIIRSQAKLLAYALGWKIRRCLSILEKKIKEFVKEDNQLIKAKIRRDFLKMFDKAMLEKLYLQKYYEAYILQKEQQRQLRRIESESKSLHKLPTDSHTRLKENT